VLSCKLEEKAVSDAQVRVDELNSRIQELNGELGETPPGPERDNIKAQIKLIRNTHLPRATAALATAKIAFDN
jgi:DNA recombination-dependent growth factor C